MADPGLGGGGGVRGGGGTAAELHSLATAVYDLWAADYGREPWALALRQSAESTVLAWTRELRLVTARWWVFTQRLGLGHMHCA